MASVMRSLIWRPISSGMVWAGGGVGVGWMGTQLLWSQSPLYAATGGGMMMVTATVWGGAALVLLPLGLARGAIAGVQDVMETQGRPAIQQVFQGMNLQESRRLLLKEDGQTHLLERMTLGNGWQGRMVRTLASPFLPSTSQMMIRVQEAMDQQQLMTVGAVHSASAATDGKVVAAAVGGFVEGFLQDKKDTLTMIGSLLYVLVVGVGVGVDYSYRRTNTAWTTTTDSTPEDQNSPTIPVTNGSEDRPRSGTASREETKSLSWKDSLLGQRKKEEEKEKEMIHNASERKSSSGPDSTAPASLEDVVKLIGQGKETLDPYLKQATKTGQVAKDQFEAQSQEWFQAAREVVVGEDNHAKAKEGWKELVKALDRTQQEHLPDEESIRRMSKDMDEMMHKAQQRLNQDDVQEMKKDAQDLVDQARRRLAEQHKRAKVDERMKEAKESFGKVASERAKELQQQAKEWWTGGSK